MKKLLFLCFIFLSLNTYALDSNKLINFEDLNILFDLQKNDWNENVLFLIKKNSFSKVDSDSDVFYLKSIFNDGEIITIPVYSEDIVKKIKFEYFFFDYNKENLKIISNHFNSFKNFCFEYLDNDKSIQVVISKCN
ncbi:hypothetical protein OA952_00260 [Pelagibacteraceae bacterium]|nr:hypothetical protein [Pelagibacteraceae bacterium]